MTLVTCNVSISVDAFMAGPDQSIDNPIGVGGLAMHQWHFDPQGEDARVYDEWMETPGAFVMGRNMFSPGRGPWDLDWRGWWGEVPPYHQPVYVLTHHPREPLMMDGGTTFHFVTDGPESALAQAKASAGDKHVEIAGGVATVNGYLAAGAIDELQLHVSPMLLGVGERLFDGVGPLELAPIRVVESPYVTHIKYRIGGTS